MEESSGRLEYTLDRRREQPPLRALGGVVFATVGRETVELGAAAASLGTRPPLGPNPAAILETIERRIQTALPDLEHVVGELAQALGNGPPVERSEDKGLENEQVEGALQQIGAVGHARPPVRGLIPCRSTTCTSAVVGCQGMHDAAPRS